MGGFSPLAPLSSAYAGRETFIALPDESLFALISSSLSTLIYLFKNLLIGVLHWTTKSKIFIKTQLTLSIPVTSD